MKKVLVFQHEFREHPSRLNQYALENNLELKVMRLWEPYEMPNPLEYAALIILGGSMNVRDEFPSKADELRVIKECVGKIPILGICLGGQLLAHALGAPIQQMKAANGEPFMDIGFETVTLLAEGQESPLFKGFSAPFVVTQLHGDTFDIPEGAQHLATGERCRNQAFSYGHTTFGLQFHLEYTPYTLAHLFEANRKWVPDYKKGGEERLMNQAFKTKAVMQEQFDRLMNNFLSV